MRNTKRAALWGAPLSLALLLAACGDDDSADDSTTTTTEATTSSSETTVSTAPPETPTTATTAPPTSATASPATETPTTAPDDGTEGEYGNSPAAQLIRAWGAGDRDRALELATPEAVDELFGTFDPGGDDWDLTGCDGAAGTLYCTFDSASKAMTVRVAQPNVAGEDGEFPPISRIEFQA
jgi:hypothetical protein